MASGYKVVSSIDGEEVFPAISVMRWAATWRVLPKSAAQRLARENEDQVCKDNGERLLVLPAV